MTISKDVIYSYESIPSILVGTIKISSGMGTFKFPCFFILGIFTIRFPDRAVFAVLDERGTAQLRAI